MHRLVAIALLAGLIGSCQLDRARPAFHAAMAATPEAAATGAPSAAATGPAAETRAEAKAAPGKEGASAVDANGDGRITKEEFLARFPSMRPGAFDAIDSDRDGVINKPEWEAFKSRHGAGMGKGMQPQPQPEQEHQSGVPLVVPPSARPQERP
ncbi:MAG: EF-hand domain-containing protein [Desulfovibrio sp.]|nr:EF-hand domain-containing protein [Desulfovibrio sp.]